MTRIPAFELRSGDLVSRVPYAGDEKMPVTVKWVHQARKRGSLIIEGTDANGKPVMIPLGHKTNFVEVER